MSMQRRATIKDIAERAGVSKTTVSFALNSPERISRSTFEQIMKIVDELGYFPNPVARTLTTKRLGALGLLLPQPLSEALRNPHLCEVVGGIGDECDRHGISLTMIPPLQGKIIEAARRSFVDAFITIGVGPEHEVIEFLNARRVPFVTIDGEESGAAVNIGIRHEQAAFDLMKYILSLKPGRILVLRLLPDRKHEADRHGSFVLERRLEGFSRAMAEEGICFGSPEADSLEVESSFQGGYAAGISRLAADTRPDVIMAMADIAALGVCRAAKDLGIAVPEELSVAGFDDISYGKFAIPSLTTVHQPAAEKGRLAASLALTLLEGGSAESFTFPHSLEIRGSTRLPFKESGRTGER
jgi:alanine racemase